MSQIKRIAAWMSQGVNVLLLWPLGRRTAHPDLTVSARCHVEGQIYGHRAWERVRRAIDAFFFWEPDHCASSFRKDVEFSRRVTRWSEREG